MNNKQKKYWDETSNDWRNYGIPFRPSPAELIFWRSHLNSLVRKDNILLLGSTPELRDLLVDFYLTSKVFICDFSWKMTEAMSHDIHWANPDEEIWLKADWRNSALPAGYFDVILGDWVLMQFQPHEYNGFLQAIERLLAHNGIFITRCRIRKRIDFSSKEAMAEEMISTADRNSTQTAAQLMWSFYDLYTKDDLSVDKISALKMAQTIVLHTPNPITELLIEKINRTLSVNQFRWQWGSPTEEFHREILGRHFLIEEGFSPDEGDLTSQNTIFCLRKKSLL